VEQHGGSLKVTSDGLGMGSRFSMSLPLFRVPDPKDENSNRMVGTGHSFSYSARRDQDNLVPLQILVVDDSATNRKLLTRILQNHGHQCDGAENGEIAVAMAVKRAKDNDPYDTILLDYEMPVMSGPDACQEIRSQGCDSFVVGITGNVLPEDVTYFKSCGANAVLPKPFEFAVLETLWVEYGVGMGRPQLEV